MKIPANHSIRRGQACLYLTRRVKPSYFILSILTLVGAVDAELLTQTSCTNPFLPPQKTASKLEIRRSAKMLAWLILCTFLASSQALIDMKERLKDRVVHVETLIHRGRWLWQNDNKDADGSRYLWIDLIAERDTYYQPRVQYQTTACVEGKYLCFESLSLRNYYLAAGFPAGGEKHTVNLVYSTYVDNDNRFHWKVMCENDSMERCKFIPVRFESEGWLMVADNWGHDDGHDGGHYDATLGKEDSKAWFRVHAPNPTDGYNQVYSNTNTGTSDQQAQYSTTIGVTQTQSTSHTVTTTTSTEIGGAFKAFSASASHSIEDSWQYAESSTYEAAKKVTHKMTIPGRTKIVLKQLIGNYAGEFDVGDDQYLIEEMPLDGGATHTRRIRILNPDLSFGPASTDRAKTEL